MRGSTLLLAFWLALAATGPALAHASLVSAEPADGAVVDNAPGMVRLRFNESVAPAVIRLIDARGVNRDIAIRAHDEIIDIPLPADLPKGTQTVSYRIISADGHPVGGSLLFSIGAPTGAAAASAPTGSALAPLIWLARIGLYIGLFSGVGGVFFAAWVARGATTGAMTRVALALGAVSAVLSLGLQGLDLLGLPLTALASPGAWLAAIGTSLGWSVLLALLAFGLAWWSSASRSPRLARELAGVALVGAGLALAVTGHAASAAPHWLTRPAVFLHAVAAAYWVGALLPLLGMIRSSDPMAAPVLERFSRGAMVAVAVLIAAGAALATIQLGSIHALYDSAYGQILSAKLLAVLALFGLAALNRLRLTPALTSGRHNGSRDLARSVRAEIGLMLVILALVAGWRFTPPPRALAIAALPLSIHIHQAKAMADVTLRPGRVGANDVVVDLLSGDFGPLNPMEVTVSLSQPGAGIEPIQRKAERAADGQWQVRGLPLPVSGTWQVSVNILITDFEQVELTDTLTVP